MLSLGRNCKIGISLLKPVKWCRYCDTDIAAGIDIHKKENFIQFLSSKEWQKEVRYGFCWPSESFWVERTPSRKTCQKAQTSVEENRALKWIWWWSGRNLFSQLIQPDSHCKFWNKFFFHVSSFYTSCLRSLIISFQIVISKWSRTCFSFTLAWNKTCKNDVVW